MGATKRMSARHGASGGRRTYLYSAGGHLELCRELFAEYSIWLCVLAEDVFEDLELVSGSSLSVLYFVWDVGEESPEIDRRGVDSGGHQGRNASTGIPWLGRVHVVMMVLCRLSGRKWKCGEMNVYGVQQRV